MPGSRRSALSRLKKYTHLKAIVRARRLRKDRVLRPQPVPLSMTGKWVAWTADGLRIVTSADSPRAAKEAAAEAGHPAAMVEWIPTREELRGIRRGPEAVGH